MEGEEHVTAGTRLDGGDELESELLGIRAQGYPAFCGAFFAQTNVKMISHWDDSTARFRYEIRQTHREVMVRSFEGIGFPNQGYKELHPFLPFGHFERYDRAMASFNRYDPEGTGFIGHEAMRALWTESVDWRAAPSDDELREVIKEVDKDGDGRISLADCRSFMANLN